MTQATEISGKPVPPRGSLSKSQWRIVTLASLGGSLEFYDFIIYGIFAQYISAQFFPSSNPFVSLILSFSVLALGFLARPFGGIVLGGLGDRLGRRPVFIASLGLTTLATVAIGFLPSYATWGVAAPLFLVALRLVQGICLGGELPGAITYAVEAAPRRSALACGVVFLCVNTGVLIATLVNLGIQHALAPADVIAYGWRIAFFFGGIVGIVSFILRSRLEESPEFLALKAGKAQRPLLELVEKHGASVLVASGVAAGMAGFNGVLYGFTPVYLVQSLHYAAPDAALAMTVALVVSSIGLIFAGWAGDHFPGHLILRIGAALLLLLTFPLYLLIANHAASIVLLLGALSLVFSIVSGIWSSVVASLFPTRVRFSGVALSYNIAVTILSGFAPLAAAFSIQHTGMLAAPGLYVSACAALSFVASFFVTSRLAIVSSAKEDIVRPSAVAALPASAALGGKLRNS